MRDQYGREIDYLRISITDRCNLRCRYCMPEKIETASMAEVLTYEEILTVAACAARQGISHIKLTGGEPLVRKGCAGLAGRLKNIDGIETVTLTTNGMLLEDHLEELAQAGIDGINVSIDTRNKELFRAITGGGDVNIAIGAVEKALARGIKVKINTVSIDWKRLDIEKCWGGAGKDAGWMDMALMARELPVDVRFIEMMPVGYGKNIWSVSHDKLLREMRKMYPEMRESPGVHGFGPARYYHIPGFLGDIGLISALHGKFCDGCNRVRLTAKGYLKTCLCYEAGTDLKRILRSDAGAGSKGENLEKAMRDAIWQKAKAHCFETPSDVTEKGSMSSIGG